MAIFTCYEEMGRLYDASSLLTKINMKYLVRTDVLQSILLSGDWIVENSLLPESVTASRVTKNIEKRGIFPFPKSDLMESDVSQEVSQNSCSQNDTRILPVKSFDNEYFSLNVRHYYPIRQVYWCN